MGCLLSHRACAAIGAIKRALDKRWAETALGIHGTSARSNTPVGLQPQLPQKRLLHAGGAMWNALYRHRLDRAGAHPGSARAVAFATAPQRSMPPPAPEAPVDAGKKGGWRQRGV